MAAKLSMASAAAAAAAAGLPPTSSAAAAAAFGAQQHHIDQIMQAQLNHYRLMRSVLPPDQLERQYPAEIRERLEMFVTQVTNQKPTSSRVTLWKVSKLRPA